MGEKGAPPGIGTIEKESVQEVAETSKPFEGWDDPQRSRMGNSQGLTKGE
jgi:hypothetical protein